MVSVNQMFGVYIHINLYGYVRSSKSFFYLFIALQSEVTGLL